MPRIPLDFPFKGLSQGSSYDRQPELTSSDMLNVMAFDVLEDRARGGRRPGLRKWHPDEVSGAGNDVQLLMKAVRPRTVSTVTRPAYHFDDSLVQVGSSFLDSSFSELNTLNPSSGSVVHNAIRSGEDYFLKSKSTVWKVRPNQTVVWESDVDELFDGANIASFDFHAPEILMAATDKYLIITFERDNSNDDGGIAALHRDTGTLAWFVTFGDSTLTEDEGPVVGLDIGDDNEIYVSLQGTADEIVYSDGTGEGTANGWVFQFTQEGVLLNFAVASSGSFTSGFDPTSLAYSSTFDRVAVVGRAVGGQDRIHVYDGDLGLFEVVDIDRTATKVAWKDEDEYLIMSTAGVSYLIDATGESASETWSFDSGDGTTGAWNLTDDGATLVISSGRNSDWTGAGGNDAVAWLLDVTDGSVDDTHDDATVGGFSVAYMVPLSAAGSLETTTREVSLIAVANGVIKKYTEGAKTTPSGQSPAHLETEPYRVFGVDLYGSVYFVDGGADIEVLDLSTDAVAALSESAGTHPASPRLAARYRGRLVVSGLINDAHNWFMSALGDPTDWDYSPSTTTATQAVAGNNSEAGLVGDVITALVPYSDDLFIFGCDQSIWQMGGDPAAGGAIDLLTDGIGMAWGASWAKSPDGQMFFMGSDGVYRFTPGERPVSITRDRLDKLFEDINLATVHPLLTWDVARRGLWLTFGTLNNTDTQDSFFWSARLDAWSKQELPAAFGPTALFGFDSDHPEDRQLLIGCKDGFIRRFAGRSNDDGNSITSRVRFSPVEIADGAETIITAIHSILAEDSGDVTLKVFVGQTAEQVADQTTPRYARTLSAGRNTVTVQRAKGAWVQVMIEQVGGDPWALERLTAEVQSGGKVRRLKRG